MKDFTGKEIKVGDEVAVRVANFRNFTKGIVESIDEKKVYVRFEIKGKSYLSSRMGERVIVIK